MKQYKDVQESFQQISSNYFNLTFVFLEDKRNEAIKKYLDGCFDHIVNCRQRKEGINSH